MKKSLIPFICLNSIIILFLASCRDGGVKVVSKVPQDFISTYELNNCTDSILRCVFWDDQISLMDSDICIYQTSIRNGDFIVKCEKDYYINETRYLEMAEIAVLAREERSKTYHLGDEVEILGAGETVYTVKIISVEAVATEPYNSFYMDSLITYYIKYTVFSNVAEHDYISINFIDMVNTKNGVEYSSLNLIDTDTVSVKIRTWENDEEANKIEAIIIRSPEYPGLTYRVVVDA